MTGGRPAAYGNERRDGGETVPLSDPEFKDQLAQVIPVMRARLLRLLSGPNATVKAATAIRVAVAHYIVRSDDGDQFLAQLRHAVGIK